MVTTWSWVTAAAARASRTNRLSEVVSVTSPGRRTFRATFRRRLTSHPLYTTPIPPSPSRSRTLYGPSRSPGDSPARVIGVGRPGTVGSGSVSVPELAVRVGVTPARGPSWYVDVCCRGSCIQVPTGRSPDIQHLQILAYCSDGRHFRIDSSTGGRGPSQVVKRLKLTEKDRSKGAGVPNSEAVIRRGLDFRPGPESRTPRRFARSGVGRTPGNCPESTCGHPDRSGRSFGSRS